MQLLLLCLGLTLFCTHGEGGKMERSNFDLEKISGKWYTIALASDRKETIEEDGSMRVFVQFIQALQESNLYFKFHKHVDGECTVLQVIANHQSDDTYTVEYDGHNEFSIVDTDYDTYLIILLRNFNNGETFQLGELYGRNPDVSPEIKERFREVCEENEIGPENILDLTNADRCLQARDDK